MKKEFLKQGAIILVIFFGLHWFVNKIDKEQEIKEIPYTQFVSKIRKGELKQIVEENTRLVAKGKENGSTVNFAAEKLTDRAGNDSNLVNAINSSNSEIKADVQSENFNVWGTLSSFLQFAIVAYFISRATGTTFGKTQSKVEKEKISTKFSDVAGIDEVKEELAEVVDFLKNPEKFKKSGARAPKGVLLLGEPGTGKTLLAKAVAGEADASFFNMPGSEFMEMYVGVGASRVRDLFKKARENAPSIIFIDEIDAIGGKRSMDKSRGESEREQTLNQLLVEMDGFNTDTQIIVIAATNREDILDNALLRAGRFDRKINVNAPDLKGRIEILNIHSRNKKLSDDVSLEAVAKITPGFVGADLENLMNEAAIFASRKNSEVITMVEIDEAVDKIGMGLGQKNKIIKPKEKLLLAYHEAGHALVTELNEYADPVHKVTIIPRGGAGGFMMPLPDEKLVTTSRELIAEIQVLFGGRAAEELVLDDVSTGAYSDIKRATQVARTYIEKVGMNENIGPVNVENVDGYSISSRSSETVREIELEIRKLLKKQYQKVLELLNNNRDKLDGIAGLLLEKETITGEEVRNIINEI